MKKTIRHLTATVAPLAMLIGASFPAAGWAGTLDGDEVLIGTSGDGIVYVDTTENVVEPGMKAITFTSTRVPGSNPPVYVAPFENITLDYTDGTNPADPLGKWTRGEISNCLMASNTNYCDSESGSGKRIKAYLYGPNPLDMRMSTTPSTAYPQVDYFTFGKISNFAPARITGFSIEVLDADGNTMTGTDAEKVLFNLDATQVGLGARLVDGLFGEGGQEGEEGGVGFFDAPDGTPGDTGRAGFSLVQSTDVLDFGGAADLISNDVHTTFFGNAMIYDAAVPDGIFWDETPAIDTDESTLLTWYHTGDKTWYYGNLGTAATPELDAKLAAIAVDLGVAVADLGYTAGGDAVPAAIIAAMEGDDLFAIDKIEDLRNANLNYTITVGNVEDGQFIIRIAPRFAPVVELAGTPYQFAVAGALDASNIPYLAADPGYQAMITQVMALPTLAEQQSAIEELGYSFLRTYMATGLTTGREQVSTLNTLGRIGDGPQGSTWSMTDTISGFLSGNGTVSSFDRTTNNIGFDVTSGSLWAGIESEVSSDFSLGGMFGGFQSDGTIDAGRGSLDSKGFGTGLFARGNNVWGHLNFQAMAGYQNLDFTSSRNVIPAGLTARGETDADLWFGAITADWMTKYGDFEVGPTASLEYYNLSTKGFTETGAGIWNLTIGEQDDNVTIGRIGLKANYRIVTSSWDIGTSGHVAYAEQWGSDAVNSAKFAGLPQMNLAVDGLDSSSVDFGVGFKASPASHDNLQFGVSYRGTVASNDTSNSVQVFARMKF
ncbi:putative autotransporter protein [Hoeflea sp. IMCC20628]|nr:putative autotransporter protein [Hoeflea sp. IMCC20628]